ncbi:hypothetical protein K8I31_13545, partial [bacterium]|nr:hypothetical protein [bacterium]
KSDGNYEIQVQLITPDGNINLGFKNTAVTGEWVELVWPISTFVSPQLTSVSGFGGFIQPADATYAGQLYVDNVYFYRPEGTPEVETIMVYDFDETDPDTLFTAGWQSDDESAQPLFPGEGEVDPSQGTNYMTFPLTSGWASNIRTIDASSAFDRWDEVLEIWLDARVSATPTNWGPQSALIIQSNSGGWDQYAENSYQSAVDDWTLLTWSVDMSGHAESLQTDDGSFLLRFSTNNDAANDGMIAYFDNLRVVVPVQNDVSGWSLY